MARLRHIAIVVEDLEKSAAFYERAFGLKRVEGARGESATARRIFLTDGEVNLALLKYKGATGAGGADPETFLGLHHIGFQVDNLAAGQADVEAAGATYYFDLGKEEDEEFERKFHGPDRVLLDISHKGWAGTPTKVLPAKTAPAAVEPARAEPAEPASKAPMAAARKASAGE